MEVEIYALLFWTLTLALGGLGFFSLEEAKEREVSRAPGGFLVALSLLCFLVFLALHTTTYITVPG